MEIKKIETYSLYEFCQAVQHSIIEGWRFDFESNELFPTAFGSMLVTGMVKDKAEVIAEVETEVIAEVTQDNIEVKAEDNTEVESELKRGRPAKK